MPTQPRRTYFGPYEGDPNAPRNSLAYRLWRDGYYDRTGTPHRAGDIALTPDLIQGARYGDTVTRGGITGRYTDVTRGDLRNRVDVWSETGNLPNEPGRTLDSNEWQRSYPGERFLPGAEPTVEIPTANRSLGNLDYEPSLFSGGGPSLEVNAGDTPPPTPSGGGRSPSPFSDPNEDWVGVDYPSVPQNEIRGYGPNNDYGVSPTLFPDQNDWWRTTGDVTAGTEITSPGAGGSIWADNPPMPSVGGRSPTIDDPSQDWRGVNETVPSSGGRSPSLIDDPNDDWRGVTEPPIPSGGGLPPSPIEDPNNDWTGRRPTEGEPTQGEPTVETPTGGAPRYRGDIANFGGNLTLGSYLNTPLSWMHYGEGYPAVSGGDVTYGGGTVHTPGSPGSEPTAGQTPPGSAQTGDTTVGSQGSIQTGYGPLGVPNYTGSRVGDPNTVWTRDPSAPGGWVPKALPYVPPGTVGPGQYYDWTSGTVRPLNNPGSFSQNKNQGEAYQSVNSTERTPAEGHDVFYGGPGRALGRMTEEGMSYVPFNSIDHSPEHMAEMRARIAAEHPGMRTPNFAQYRYGYSNQDVFGGGIYYGGYSGSYHGTTPPPPDPAGGG